MSKNAHYNFPKPNRKSKKDLVLPDPQPNSQRYSVYKEKQIIQTFEKSVWHLCLL